MRRPVSDIEALSVWSDIALLLMAVATVHCIVSFDTSWLINTALGLQACRLTHQGQTYLTAAAGGESDLDSCCRAATCTVPFWISQRRQVLMFSYWVSLKCMCKRHLA